jgi:hypothetical protein
MEFVLQTVRNVLAMRVAFFLLVSCLAYSSTLKMEAVSTSETSVDFYRIERRYTPEGSNLHGKKILYRFLSF